VAGVTTVSTLPQVRRRDTCADRGRRLTACTSLAPRDRSSTRRRRDYQRFGYGIVSTHHAIAWSRHLGSSHAGAVRGALREATRDDSALLKPLPPLSRSAQRLYSSPTRLVAAGLLADPLAGQTLSILVYEEDGGRRAT
jgi:hypothetical protein